MRKFKTLFVICLVLALVLTSCTKKESTTSETTSVKNKNINIATASIGGAYYAVGQEIANLTNKHSSGLTMAPEVTAGAIENPRLVDQGDADFGITNANLAYAAVRGESPYTKVLNIKAVGNLHPSVFHIIALESSGIKTIADLKGKKVAVGPAGGGTLPVLEMLLGLYGLTINDITPSYIAYNDGFTQLSDGNVDVALALSGYPASSVMELSTTKKIRFVEVTEEDMAKVEAEYPYYATIMVPADTYGMNKDARALGIMNVFFVNADLDDETVYKVASSVYDNLEEFAQNNATAKQIDASTISETVIELHPGAKKYFDEKN